MLGQTPLSLKDQIKNGSTLMGSDPRKEEKSGKKGKGEESLCDGCDVHV